MSRRVGVGVEVVVAVAVAVVVSVGVAGCSASSSGAGAGAYAKANANADAAANANADADAGANAGDDAGASLLGDARDAAAGDFASWLRGKIPASGRVVSKSDGSVAVVHTAAAGDTPLSIATAYLDVTDVYYAKDLAKMIDKAAIAPGSSVDIPHLLSAPYKDPEADRMRWPDDGVMRGVFITGAYAQVMWPQTLAQMKARKQFNAVVLDAKDYEGPVNYPTKAKIAREIEADKDYKIPDFARAIRFAHAAGIRVIARIPCFHDPLAAKKVPRLSLMSKFDHPIDMGWLDPMNEEAQTYVLELTQEAIDNGADEIQLDYIRFPVVGPVKQMKLPNPGTDRTHAIRDIVRKVHAVTAAARVPLSLDIFGVTATGDRYDWDRLGQDISVLGPECEALSPMVYPSHYGDGYRGFTEPGAHPEIVGIGTKMAVGYLPKGKKNAVIRSWLQAFPWRASNYGPKYLVEEARQAEINGGVGWLMWSPGNEYSAAWNGFPPTPPDKTVAQKP